MCVCGGGGVLLYFGVFCLRSGHFVLTLFCFVFESQKRDMALGGEGGGEDLGGLGGGCDKSILYEELLRLILKCNWTKSCL